MRENMDLRLLDTGKSSAAMNMAVDEAVMLSGKPTLRFYGWEPRAVSIGYFQGIGQEVDLEKCAQLGVDVVRRLTGGGAVYHDQELTYSLIVPEGSGLVARDVLESYGRICAPIVEGLKSLGLEAEFKPINDILVNGRKISGNAQTRRKGMVLQHGTILLDVDVEAMFSLLRVPSEKLRGKMIKAAEERVTSVRAELGQDVTFSRVKEALTKAFRQHSHMRELKQGTLSKEEGEGAEKLAETKYSTKEWNFMR